MTKKINTTLLIELMTKYTDSWCKTINNKLYNLITNSQLIKIIEDYISQECIPQPKICIECDYYEDKAETAPPEYYCQKLGRYKMNADMEPPGDCPLEKI